MKKTLFVSLLFIALLGGFGMGYAYRIATETNGFIAKPVMPPEPVVVTQPKIDEEESREKELLIQAIEELNLTTAELEEAQRQLNAQAESVRRFNWLMDKWSANEFGNLNRLNMGFSSFTPDKGLSEFFGWDEATVSAMNKIGESMTVSVKKWESEHAVYVETEEDKLVYELPVAPEAFKEGYLREMAEILPESDFESLSKIMAQQFRKIEKQRKVSLSIQDNIISPFPFGGDNPKDQEWMIIEVEQESDIGYGMVFPKRTMIPYEEGRTIPVDWNHIFNLETDPNAPEPPYRRGEENSAFNAAGNAKFSPIR